MKDFFGVEIKEGAPASKVPGNPLLRVYGSGPEGKTCKTCSHLWRKRRSRTYLKCELRENTNGPGTDHQARWPACGKYSEEQ